MELQADINVFDAEAQSENCLSLVVNVLPHMFCNFSFSCRPKPSTASLLESHAGRSTVGKSSTSHENAASTDSQLAKAGAGSLLVRSTSQPASKRQPLR